MDILIFLYNIFLIVLYTICLSFSVLNYSQKKKPLFFILGILFLSYISDNIIIYMTEYLEEFSLHYDLQFMTVPAFKTVIVLTDSFCLTAIQRLILPGRRHSRDIAGLVLLGLVLLFVPMTSNGALKVWLYYLPAQIYLFYLSASGLFYLKKHPGALDKEMSPYRWILWTGIAFSILILIEDTIVIFSYDVYSSLLVKINNRSMSEDIMSIIFAIFALIYLVRQLRQPVIAAESLEDSETANNVLSGEDGFPAAREADRPGDNRETTSRPGAPEAGGHLLSNGIESQEASLPAQDSPAQHPDTAFLHFVNQYQLTSREQDILRILLADKNNQEISDALCISIGTVKTHVHNIFQKVNVAKRSQLLKMYYDYQKNMEWK